MFRLIQKAPQSRNAERHIAAILLHLVAAVGSFHSLEYFWCYNGHNYVVNARKMCVIWLKATKTTYKNASKFCCLYQLFVATIVNVQSKTESLTIDAGWKKVRHTESLMAWVVSAESDKMTRSWRWYLDAVSSKPKLQFHDVSCCCCCCWCCGWCCCLVSHLVAPLLNGLHDLLDNGGLVHGPHRGGDIGGGLWEAEAVAHGGGHSVGIGDMCGGGGNSGGSGHGGGSGVSGSVGVGEGSVKEDLGLGGGGGKSENNLKWERYSLRRLRHPGANKEIAQLTDFSMVYVVGLVRRNWQRRAGWRLFYTRRDRAWPGGRQQAGRQSRTERLGEGRYDSMVVTLRAGLYNGPHRQWVEAGVNGHTDVGMNVRHVLVV